VRRALSWPFWRFSLPAAPRGILLEDLTWVEAEKILTPDTVVVIPLGAESKEHGPHLKLNNDWLMAEYLKRAILLRADVVVAPTLNYGYYPAFLDYPGSTSLRLETSRDVVVDICQWNPRRNRSSAPHFSEITLATTDALCLVTSAAFP
jgi:hypothetical protein